MERSNYAITLDVRKTHGYVCVEMKQTDNHRRLTIRLTDGGEPYRVTEDCYAVFTAKKPDGTVIYNRCTVTDGGVIYDVTPQTTAAAGMLECEIRLLSAEGAPLIPDENGVFPETEAKLLTSAAFGIRVHPTVYNENDTLSSQTEVSALSGAVAEAKQLAKDLQAARDAGEFDGQSLYHRWSGTTLTVTSAAGSSSANLKGDKGDTGPQGAKGEKGDKGDSAFNDGLVGADGWSSENIVRRLCPPFSETGRLVCVTPVKGSPLTADAGCYLSLHVCGKNLYDAGAYPLSIEGYVSRNTGKSSVSANYRRTDYIPAAHLGGQTVTLNYAPVDATYPGMAFYDAGKNYISGGSGRNISVPENAVFMIFSVTAENAKKDVQLELGSTATAYEPYRCSTDDGDETVTMIAGEGRHVLYAEGEEGIVEIKVTGWADPVDLLERLTGAVKALGGSL